MTRVALALLRKAPQSPDARDATGERSPRGYIFDEQFDPVYDQFSSNCAHRSRSSSNPIPIWLRFAAELERRSEEYDAIVTWGERLSLAMMAVQRFSRHPKPHIPMMYWLSKPNVALPMRVFGSSMHALVTWSATQRVFAIEQLKLPPERVFLVNYMVDQVFCRPVECEVDMICSAGSENRDYQTLLEALRGTNIRCHIASDHVRIPGRFGLRHRRVEIGWFSRFSSENVTMGQLKGLMELRQLYARSRFVVIPVLESDTNHGLSAVLEGMAMGKPVICSRTRGIENVIEHNVNGIYVPIGDSAALRSAIVELWNDPERAALMGAKARAHIEANYTLDGFATNVRRAVEVSLEGHSSQRR